MGHISKGISNTFQFSGFVVSELIGYNLKSGSKLAGFLITEYIIMDKVVDLDEGNLSSNPRLCICMHVYI